MKPGTADLDAAPLESAYECGLFVIWDAAADHRQEILADLQERFQITNVYEIRWSPSRVMQNFQRFYSDIDVRGVYHIFNKGAGPLTAVTVLDSKPRVELRDTSRGLRRVNARFLEAKQAYRGWTRGLEVHCGETPQETRRDIMMLLGRDIEGDSTRTARPWNQQIQQIARDIRGADGWRSLVELFATLNQCVRYAVLYARHSALDNFRATGHGSIELITDDFHAIHRILNARPALPAAPQGGRFRVTVGGSQWRIAIRFPGDRYFDPAWAASVLDNRVHDPAGYYRLADEDYFETLAYHALVHERSPAPYRDELQVMASRLGRDDWHPDLMDDPRLAAQWLNRHLQQHGYRCPRPLDATVAYRRPLPAAAHPHWSTRRAGYGARLAAGVQRFAGATLSYFWYLRDRCLLRLPWLRSLKRMLSGSAPKASTR